MPLNQQILLVGASQKLSVASNSSTISCCRQRPKAIYSPILLMFSTLFLLLCTLPSIYCSSDLPPCTAFQACAAEVSQYPLLSETAANMIEVNVGEQDGSGMDGSGHEVEEEAFPYYDEFVSRNSPFDYQADADLSHTPICKCPEENGEEESTGCDFLSSESSSEHVMSVDRTLRLAFCRPVKQLFKSKCLGRRGLIRIIGQVDVKTGDAIASVNDTAVFCRCDSGFFQRASIEAWGDKYAFTYRCSWTPPSSLVSIGRV